MGNISAEVGKIYCKYNEETDDFSKLRVLSVKKDDEDTVYTCAVLDEDFKFTDETKQLDHFAYDEVRKEWTLLKSEGIVTLSNVVAAKSEIRDVKDVVGIFFPNNKETGYPDIKQPFVLARQAINNVFDTLGESVGMSVSLDTLPAGYALSDFMDNTSVIDSYMTHVYKTDTSDSLAKLLDNEESQAIIKDLYEHEVQYRKNTAPDFEDAFTAHPEKYTCLSGYNVDLKGFIKNTEFMNDILHIMGITTVDFVMEANKPLELDDKLLVSTLYGGIKIDKAVPMKFNYDIDIGAIKMHYVLLEDPNEVLWIVPYTTSPDEIYATELYNLTEERTSKLQERLIRCVEAYNGENDQSK